MIKRVNIICSQESIKSPIIIDTYDLSNIEDLPKDLEEIFIGDIINYIDPNNILQVLSTIKNSLSKNGIIVIEEYDQLELCLAVVNDRISTIDFNNVIRNRKQILSILDAMDILSKLGLKVMKKDVDNLKHTITAQWI